MGTRLLSDREVLPVPVEAEQEKDHRWPCFDAISMMPWEAVDSDLRGVTLRILGDSIKAHRVKRVVFDTDEFPVRRHRWRRRKPTSKCV